MENKLISSKTIVAKLISDLNLPGYDLRISDIINWIGEAIEQIGGVNRYGLKVSESGTPNTIELSGYQAKLPRDLHSLISVAYSKFNDNKVHWLPVRYSATPFARWDDGQSTNSKKVSESRLYRATEAAALLKDMHKGYMSDRAALDAVNNNDNYKRTIDSLISAADTYGAKTKVREYQDLQYVTKPGYIVMNVPDGYLRIAYTAMPLDEDNYPLIPDIASVHEAVYWYCTLKLTYPLFRSGNVSHAVYLDAKNSWGLYRKQAYAELLMPNQDELVTLRNAWNQLFPEMRNESSFYETTGQEQVIRDYNKRYTRYGVRYDKYVS